jgi:hypothetical protein
MAAAVIDCDRHPDIPALTLHFDKQEYLCAQCAIAEGLQLCRQCHKFYSSTACFTRCSKCHWKYLRSKPGYQPPHRH